jgi:hypothetical protein
VFCDTKNGVTARQVRARGADAADAAMIQRSNTAASMSRSISSAYSSKSPKQQRQGSSSTYVLPLYHSPSLEAKEHTQMAVSPSVYSRATWCSRKMFGGRKKDSVGPPLPVNISAPYDFRSESTPPIARPDSTLHPSHSGGHETQRWKAQL